MVSLFFEKMDLYISLHLRSLNGESWVGFVFYVVTKDCNPVSIRIFILLIR
jgi:hypothetical protein